MTMGSNRTISQACALLCAVLLLVFGQAAVAVNVAAVQHAVVGHDANQHMLFAAVLAAGLGFGIARLTSRPPPAPAAAPASSGPAVLKIEPKEIAAAGIVVEPATGGNLGAEILAPAITAAQPSGVAALTAHAE